MGTNRRSKALSDRQNWQKIFNATVQMLQTQQGQLETLAKERKLLEDRIRMQYDRWVSDVRLLEDQMSQMKGDLLVQDMEASLDAAKSNLVVGLKQREAHLNKLRLDYAETELEDFEALFNLLSKKCYDPKGLGRDSNRKSSTNTKNGEQSSEKLESEIRRLKQEYEKLNMEKKSEVSALLAEKKFVWNQYNILEKDYATKLKSKSSELERADEKVMKLVADMEQLQSSNSAKDDRIAILTKELTEMKEQSNKTKEETYRPSEELDSLRKSRSASVTPVLNRCTAGTKTSSRGKQSNINGSNVILKKTSSSVQDPDSVDDFQKGGRRSKRMRDENILLMSETPKLLPPSFKIPKVKTPYLQN